MQIEDKMERKRRKYNDGSVCVKLEHTSADDGWLLVIKIA